jgi:hypothetical protein
MEEITIIINQILINANHLVQTLKEKELTAPQPNIKMGMPLTNRDKLIKAILKDRFARC